MFVLDSYNLRNDQRRLAEENENRPYVRDSIITASSNGFTTATEGSSLYPNNSVQQAPCPIHGPFYSPPSGAVMKTEKVHSRRKRNAIPKQVPIAQLSKPRPPKLGSAAYLYNTGGNDMDQIAWIRATIDDAREDYWKSQALRKCLMAAVPEEELEKRETEKWTIMRNLITISLAFLFVCSAFIGLQNLQTSINGMENLGSVSLSCVYMGTVISCLFTPGYLLNRIGCKMTMIVSLIMYAMYMLVNFRTTWYSLLPGSLVLGFASAPLWAAKSAYLTETGIRYAELNFESPNIVMVRFFGIFFTIVHLGQVFGNLISSWILKAAEADSPLPTHLDAVDHTCGQHFIDVFHLSNTAARNLQRPTITIIRSLCGVYFCCTLVALMILSLFLNQLSKDLSNTREKPRFNLEVWKTTMKQLQRPRTWMLIPLTIFNGMEQAFISADFSKGYVGCCLGISHIGSVMTCFGVCNAICSVLFGPLIQLFGRMPLFMFGAVIDMLMIFTLLIWPPNPGDSAVFYVVAATWGMADGVWNTQIRDLWTSLFSQNLEVAAANYRLWESVGFFAALVYHPFLPMTFKLYVLLAFLLFGIVGYMFVESWDVLANRLKVGKGLVSQLRRKMHIDCVESGNSGTVSVSRSNSMVSKEVTHQN